MMTFCQTRHSPSNFIGRATHRRVAPTTPAIPIVSGSSMPSDAFNVTSRTASDPSWSTAAAVPASSTPADPSGTPAPKPRAASSSVFGTPAGVGATASTPSNGSAGVVLPEKREGLVTIHVPCVFQTGMTEQEFCERVVREYDVPPEHVFGVVHRARCAFSKRDRPVRAKLVLMRILALCVAVSLLPEDLCQSKFFLYEPDLPTVLADIVGCAPGTPGIPYELQAAALYALESISRQKSRSMDVLNAIGASVNHGILVSITRRVIHILESTDGLDSVDFVEAYFSFLTQLVNTNMGGSMVVASGIIQVIVKAFQVQRPAQMKNISKFVTFLDLMTFSFPNAFTAFTACNGVEMIVSRIKSEVALCMHVKEKHSGSTLNDISFVQVAFLRSLLKFIMHMMQISGMADQLRNLIETSLPQSVLVIFENAMFFGANVLGLAINIMSTFIHNEPASLPILQESKLPQTLLQLAHNGSYPLSAEVISALPNAFGAICLNQAGLDAFVQTNPLPKFLRLLLDQDPAVRTAFYDRDMPHVVGGAVDELVRHHPTLKESTLMTVLEVVKEMVEFGQTLREEEVSLYSLKGLKQHVWAKQPAVGDIVDEVMVDVGASTPTPANIISPGTVVQEGEDEKKESRIGTLIDILARFLEGLFQNPAHSKEFVRLGGCEQLIKIYSLPSLPADFALSNSGLYSLVFLFKILMEGNSANVIPVIQDGLRNSLKKVQEFLEFSGDGSWSYKYIDLNDSTPEACAKAQEMFRSFITLECIVRLAADMFSSHNQSHGRSVSAIVLAFTGEKGESILPSLADLHRACLFEHALLKSTVPKAWFEMNPKKPPPAPGTAAPTSALSRQTSSMNVNDAFVDDAASDVQMDLLYDDALSGKDYRMMNTYFFKEFMTQIPTILTGLFQGLVRLLTTKPISAKENRPPAQKIMETIAGGVKHCLATDWSRVQALPLTNGIKIAYVTSVVTFVEGMITDKRHQGSLQTSFVVAFDKCGGLNEVFTLTDFVWESICGLHEDDASQEENKERVSSLFLLLEKCLGILASCCDMKVLHNSPFTFAIQGKDKDRGQPGFFDAYEHLVSMRLRVLPIVTRIWESERVISISSGKPGANIWKPLLGIISQILKADGEVSPAASGAVASGSGLSFNSPFAQALLGRLPGGAALQPIVPDAAHIEQLVDMGYPRGAAETALIRCGNNVMRAVDYILSHPALVTDALARAEASSAPPQPPTAPLALSTAATNDGVAVEASNSGEAVAGSQSTVSDSQVDAGGTVPVPSNADGNVHNDDDMDEESDEEAALAQALAMSVAPTTVDLEVPATIAASAQDAGDSDCSGVAQMEAMTTDTESSLSAVAGKGKGKVVDERARLDSLNDLRAEFTKRAIRRSLELVGMVDFITFELKDLLCLIGKGHFSVVSTPLFTRVEETLKLVMSGNEDVLPRLALELHLTALLLNDVSFKKSTHETRSQFFETVIKFFNASTGKLQNESLMPKWLPPAILIVETIISEWDENRLSVPIVTTSSSSEPAVSDINSTPSLRSDIVLEPMIHLLGLSSLDSDSLHACLRVLVRLTRSHSVAEAFFNRDGMRLIFRNDRLGEFPAQFSLITVILRHLVESKKVLASSMEVEITNWFKTARSKDVSSYLKGNAPLVCRDAEVFNQVTAGLCLLPNYDPKYKSPQISLKPKLEDRSVTLITDIEERDLSRDVVYFLINGLLESKALTAGTEKDAELVARAAHFKRGYILQALTELVGSFSICKAHVVSFTKNNLKGTPHKSSRHPLLYYLLTDVLPLPASNENDSNPIMKRRVMESAWTVTLITKLCTGSTLTEDKALNEQHQVVCKAVVESISRALKDALTSTESADIRYGRFYGLADLCHQLLTIRYPPQTSKLPASQNPVLAATKTMLEKGFTNTLTTILAEIDAFHPRAKLLTSTVLKPLETLTKMAVKIAKLPANSDKATPAKKATTSNKMMVVESEAESTDYGSSEDERGGMHESENEEISNIYRNSALNMYNVQPDDVIMDDISDSDDDEGGEEFDEGEYDDGYSGEEGDVDEDDDDNSDPEDDMEIIVPQPYQGAHEDIDSTDNEAAGADDEMNWEDESSEEDEHADEIAIHTDGEVVDDDDDDGEDGDDGDEGDDDDDDQNDEDDQQGEEDNAGDDENSEDDDDDLVIPFDENDGQLSDEGVGGNERSNRRRRYMWDPVGGDGFDGDLFDRPIPLNRQPAPLEESHPLLINLQHQMPPTARNFQSQARGSLLSNDLDWHNFIQTIAGPQAVQQIQQMERQGQAFRIEIQSNGVPVGDFRDLFNRRGLDPTTLHPEVVLSSTDSASEDRALASLHSSSPIQTSLQRWVYEARLLYGLEYAEVALRILDKTLSLLTPAALAERKLREKEEAERKAHEEEERKVEEEKRKEAEAAATKAKAEEEERERIRLEAEEKERLEIEATKEAKADSEVAEAAQSSHSEATAMDVTPGDLLASSTTSAAPSTVAAPENIANAPQAEMPSTGAAASAPSRVLVEMGGQTIDITDSGIDPEFLAAIPEDLRMEVLNQHLQDQRQRTAAAPIVPDNPDMSDFLNALPPDIRNDALRSLQQPVSSSNSRAALGGSDINPAFFGNTDPLLRQDNDFGFLAEANNTLRNISRLRQGISQAARRIIAGADEGGTNPVSAPKVLKKSTRDVVQLVEKPALFTLLRLLFVPEPANKETLNRLLLNLCENSRSRLDLMSMFLSILWDGNADFILLDKNFSQMTIKGKGKSNMTPKKVVSFSTAQPFESIPNLIVQRCLETLIFLVGSNDQIVVFFLQENEQFANTFGKYRPQSKRKGKDKAVSNVYPVVVLLSLVERPIFLSNPVLLEQLVQLLTFVLRPISSLGGAKPKDAATIGLTPATGQPPASEAASGSSSAPAPGGDASSAAADKPPAVPVGPELAEEVLKVPMIPDQYVRAIVQVLTVGECSIKTFQYTLSMIQHLAPLNNNREIITSELVAHSQSLGSSIVADLNEVAQVLTATEDDIDVNTGPLAKFSTPASQQAKFLRVLKTLDYIHSKLNQSQKDKEKESEKFLSSKPAFEAVESLSGSMGVRDAQISSKPEPTIEENLAAIFNKIDMPMLWQALGTVMGVVSQNDDLTRVGTVLLPLIEAFMVISKPFVAPKHNSVPQGPPKLIHSASFAKNKDNKPQSHEELFNSFTEDHKKILNVMVRNNPTLMSGSFSLLIQNPKVLEFDNKRTYFSLQLHKKSPRDHYGSLQLNVRRSLVFEDSYHQLHGRNGEEIKYGKLNIRFHDEEGVDAGGVTREFFQVLARQMFNPDYALFKPSAVDKVTYQPNRSSWINPDHLLYFRFVGRIIGKAIYDGRLLDAYFTRSFYKCMLEIPVDWKDMEAIDPEFHKSLQWMLQNDITDVIDLTFSTEVDDFGVQRIIDLKPDGRNIAVTEENKQEYVSLITEQKLTKAIQQQIDAFLGGFHDIIPKDLIKIFNEQELELLISGLPDIDIDDMKNNTEYQNYSPSSPQIQWFWRAVRSFSQEERAKLIQFATGTSKVPLEGFKALEGSNGIQKFQIHKDFASKLRLPSAHTCFNQIDLPEYDTYEDLRATLLTAISECATGFGFV
ncbi:hypothetical protein BC830DRAFT_406826 [Chytriomyces sp. MP71]|nr:hypothetical protein BC830DRAFT_406826 [Chytriomyces sp. MP71]